MGAGDTSGLIEDFRHGVADDRVIDFLKEVPKMMRDIDNLQRIVRELKSKE